VRRLLGEAVRGDERVVSTDQANRSIAVDERFLVKWFRQPLAHARLETLERLASAGFAHMPRFLGAVAEDELVVAVVTELVPGATDGWQWFVDDVVAWMEERLPLDALERTAAQMGAITAEMHRALAGDDLLLGSLEPLRAWAAARRDVAVELTRGPAGERLRARLHQIDHAMGLLGEPGPVEVQHVHGDLHAGQFLRAGDRLLVIDFDGDPMADAGAAAPLQPVERDVAGLVQSLDHVGRIAARRCPGADPARFIETATASAIHAYRTAHALDEGLLLALRVAQELHEYAYAATMLPVWQHVPDAAMAALFPLEDQTP
jgi:maltokinase